MAAVLAASLALAAAGPGWSGKKGAEKDKAEEPDPLDLAALLISDGNHERADDLLAGVDPGTAGLDLARFYLLWGLAALEMGEADRAVDLLRKSVQAGQADPIVHLFLSQAMYSIGDWEGTLSELDLAGEAASGLAAPWRIRARCLIETGDKAGAFSALQAGIDAFPEDLDLKRSQVLLLVDMGLFQEALDRSDGVLAAPGAGVGDHVAIAEALRVAHRLDRAIVVLEEARLRFPGDIGVLKQLARSYLDAGLPYTAGRMLHEAARIDPSLLVEVAELYRRAGRLHLALSVNSQVPDQKAKTRQRLGLLIDLGRFEEAVSLEPRLSRLGLLEDSAVAYALAYSHWRNGSLDEAERLLGVISDLDVHEKAVDLLRAIDSCRLAGPPCD